MKSKRSKRIYLTAAIVSAIFVTTLFLLPTHGTKASAAGTPSTDIYARAVPNIDVTQAAAVTRQATGQQTAAAESFKAAYNKATIRWNNFSGSTDVVMGFHTAPSSDTPENTARAFINANSALFAVDSSSLVLESEKQALGGYLVRFKQVSNGLDVAGGGIGILMNSQKQIRMVMGSPFRA